MSTQPADSTDPSGSDVPAMGAGAAPETNSAPQVPAEDIGSPDLVGDGGLKDQVVKTIQTVFDPEIPVNIHSLGLIYGVKISADGLCTVTLTLTPQMTTVTNADGVDVQVPRIGVVVDSGPYGLLRSVRLGVTETVWWTAFTLRTLGEIIVGDRGREDLGGPIMIAQISGQVAQIGWVATLWFMAVLSINLGLINLFPVPMLDGGHLLYYAAEAVRGRPLGVRAQEYGFRIGLVLVLTLMVFATWNDLERLQVVTFLKELIF